MRRTHLVRNDQNREAAVRIDTGQFNLYMVLSSIANMQDIVVITNNYVGDFVRKYLNDRIIVWASLAALLFYVVFYGINISHGFLLVPVSLSLGILLTPFFLIDVLKTVIETLTRKHFYSGDQELEKITVIIPSNDGAAVLRYTLRDLLNRFRAEQIIVSSNGSTDETAKIARRAGVRIIETKEKIGKVNAINIALKEVRTKYTLIMDDDVLIGESVIPTNPLGSDYSGVAFRVYPAVKNWLTKIQAYEYRKSMDIGRAFHNTNATVSTISGAIGLFETKELKRQILLHTGEFCGEDLQRTLLIHLSKENHGVVIADSIVKTVAPSSINSLFRQRVLGWSPGMYANFPNFMKIIFQRKTPLALRYDALYYSVFVTLTDPLRLLAFPVLIFNPSVAAILYVTYVALESIPYFVLKRKDPYWVVLTFPFYGIFNFVARIIAFPVFLYRRLLVRFAKMENLDDYRTADLRHRFYGLYATQFVVMFLIALILLLSKPAIAADLAENFYTKFPRL